MASTTSNGPKLRLQIVSNLHLTSSKFITYTIPIIASYLVISGDTCSARSARSLRTFLAKNNNLHQESNRGSNTPRSSDPSHNGTGPCWSAFQTDLLGGSEVFDLKLGDVWIFGHTHWCCDFLIEEVRVFANQRGDSRNDVRRANRRRERRPFEIEYDAAKSIEVSANVSNPRAKLHILK
ncbi:hypothetical protein G7Y89_g14263 [Cudoniella acicularis]|uniref:Uncharacterized protein n=1 Tax=Cudoniella acicularis TaxID=354080 RepID=A0A8H4R5N8_9HELO|nr:hypothetical protein G7Y89_g14263 [Cudoniella acicularis]